MESRREPGEEAQGGRPAPGADLAASASHAAPSRPVEAKAPAAEGLADFCRAMPLAQAQFEKELRALGFQEMNERDGMYGEFRIDLDRCRTMAVNAYPNAAWADQDYTGRAGFTFFPRGKTPSADANAWSFAKYNTILPVIRDTVGAPVHPDEALPPRVTPRAQPERNLGQGTSLTLHAFNGMINIDSETDQISYSVIEGMYKTGDGYGCQVGDEARREAIERFCGKITDAYKEYRDALNHPAAGGEEVRYRHKETGAEDPVRVEGVRGRGEAELVVQRMLANPSEFEILPYPKGQPMEEKHDA